MNEPVTLAEAVRWLTRVTDALERMTNASIRLHTCAKAWQAEANTWKERYLALRDELPQSSEIRAEADAAIDRARKH